MKLRDGSEVEDPRLGHIPEFDERSRDYPLRALTGSRPPKSKEWECPARLDQGNEGACVGFAWAHELASDPVASRVSARMAREQIYWAAQKIDRWPGGSYPGAKPRYEGTSILAGAKAVEAMGAIAEYWWAFSLEDLIRAVSEIGPAVVGWKWHEGMFHPDAKGWVKASGSALGGHAICLIGVDMERKCFRFRNSWGAGWGLNGDGFISFDDAGKLIESRGEQCVPVVRAVIGEPEINSDARPARAPWWKFWQWFQPAMAALMLSSCAGVSHTTITRYEDGRTTTEHFQMAQLLTNTEETVMVRRPDGTIFFALVGANQTKWIVDYYGGQAMLRLAGEGGDIIGEIIGVF